MSAYQSNSAHDVDVIGPSPFFDATVCNSRDRIQDTVVDYNPIESSESPHSSLYNSGYCLLLVSVVQAHARQS
jgi:hypothetical protein